MDRVPRLRDDREIPASGHRGSGRSRSRSRYAAVLGVVVCVAVVAGVALWFVSRPTGPEAVVRDYLNAVRERDPDRALRVAGVSRPAGEKGALLTAAAIDNRWTVGRVIAGPTRIEGGIEKAAVKYSLRYSGGGLGEGIEPGDEVVIDDGVTLATFRLTRKDGRWRIENPLVELRFANSPLWYIEVNGVKIRLTGWKPEGGGRRFFPVFPGRYTLYRDESHYVRIDPEEMYVIPDGASPPVFVSPHMRAGMVLVQMFQKAADDLVSGCVADSSRGVAGGCVLRPASGHHRTPEGVVAHSDLRDVRWEIVRMPTTDLTESRTTTLRNGLLAFSGRAQRPGELRLRARMPGPDGKPVAFVRTCLIELIPLAVAIDSQGDPWIGRWQSVGGGAKPSGGNDLEVRCRG